MENTNLQKEYKSTLDYMFACLPMYQRIGAAAYKADLNNTIDLLNLLNNPQDQFKSIHIAGTNGKGSVSNFLAAILQASGRKVGLYTSPHLLDFRERIRVNGEKISKRYVVDFINHHKIDFEKIEPSFFEMSVGMAFQYFADKKVDIAIIEVGMGGRLDSTNIIQPEISIITNIGIDHMQFLGNTIEKIAFEKAGIIKKSTPIVIGETQTETQKVFTRIANTVKAPISFADQHYSLLNHKINDGYLIVDVFRENKLFFPSLKSPLSGLYQLKNLATVFQAIEELNKIGYGISTSQIKDGIFNIIKYTHFAGRWQILHTNPLVICDTGHNEDGIKYVINQIQQTPHKKLHFVLGMVNDKEIDYLLRMFPQDAAYYFCKPNIPRGLDSSTLMEKAKLKNLNGNAYKSVKSALKEAIKKAYAEDLIFIGGSTFVVSEVIDFKF